MGLFALLLGPLILRQTALTAIGAPPRKPLRDRLYVLNLTGTDKAIEIFRGEEPADVVAQTALEAALTSEQQDAILGHLCANVLCKKRRMKKHTMFLLGLGKVDQSSCHFFLRHVELLNLRQCQITQFLTWMPQCFDHHIDGASL